ncbi:MAG: hypothetical protein V1789_04150 [PVC group bacterium]
MTEVKIFRKFAYISGTIMLLLSAGGCSPERDEYSFPPMIYDEQAYLREIEAADDLITLNETRANYAVALKKSAVVEEALNRKWELLAGKIEGKGSRIGKLSNELDLWAFDFEKIGKERYRIYLLFRVMEKLEDDYGITIEGRLADPSLLSEPYREKGYRWWHFNPLPPTTFWKEGGFIVVREDITAPDLPYELRINMDSSQGRHGNQILLGTLRKIEEIPVRADEIRAEDDPFRLAEWLSFCHARSGSTADLVQYRYREVVGALLPEAVVEDGIEYFGAKLERTGPKTGRLRLLFRTDRPLERDYWMNLYGKVSPEDIGHLSEARRKAGKRSEEWFFPIYPETSNWAAGEFVMVTRDLFVAPVPYTFSALFYDREGKKAGPLFEVGVLASAPSRP